MCLRKLFPNWFKPDPPPIVIPPIGTRTALLFAINDYPGNANDLSGCLNDARDVKSMLNALYPGFVIKSFMNALCTTSNFIRQVNDAISTLMPGDFLLIHYSGHGTQTYDPHGDEADGYDEAIYLYDGMVIDDDIRSSLLAIPAGATVLLMFDSCFSGSITRNPAPLCVRNRYWQNPDLPPRRTKRRRFTKEEMKWIVLSGCREDQTSADSFIKGEYHGAFTYYALKALVPGITYRKWIEEIHKYLPSDQYDQEPTMEGNESLFNKLVFT